MKQFQQFFVIERPAIEPRAYIEATKISFTSRQLLPYIVRNITVSRVSSYDAQMQIGLSLFGVQMNSSVLYHYSFLNSTL